MRSERVSNESVSIRAATAADAKALEWIAQRDSRHAPEAPVVVAEVNGRILAARSLSGDGVAADPFSHTSHLVEMLELEASRQARLERTDLESSSRQRFGAFRARGYAHG